MAEKEKCVLCGKERKIYKLGCCKSCYEYGIEKKWKLRDNVKFRIDSQIEMIEEFLENPKIDRNILAKKYKMTKRNVDYAIKRHCEYYYIKRDFNINRI